MREFDDVDDIMIDLNNDDILTIITRFAKDFDIKSKIAN